MSQRKHRSSALQRREALLKATVEVVAEHGYAGVTHRSVTERAGLPTSTVGYFFDSVDDLVEEAFREFTRQDIVAQTALAAALDASGATAEQIISAFSNSSSAREPYTAALFEGYLYAARNPEAREIVAESIRASRSVAETAARLVGVTDPASVGASVLSLILGAALQQTAVPGSISPETLPRTFRTLLIGSLFEAGHDALARTLRDASAASAAAPPEQA